MSVVVITGASAGVGRATARAFARRGASIGLIARGEERLQSAAWEVEHLGGNALVLPLDVVSAEAVLAAAQQVERTLGPIDIWINAAMATVYAPLIEISAEEYRRATEVTYLGTVHGTMAALRCMRVRNRGRIIQVGSALAYRAIPLQSPYCGAKFAIRGFTDSLRSELLHDGLDIHLTMVQLPAVNTPQFDWGRNKFRRRPQPVPPVFQPEVAAEAILYAANGRHREVWVAGPTIKAILANTFVPRLLDRYLARHGYAAQLSHEAKDPDTADNLFESVPGRQAAHGRFDEQALDHSVALTLLKHRASVLTLLAVGSLVLWRSVGTLRRRN